MATWSIEIDVTNRDQKRVAVTGTRTDGEDVRSYSLRTMVKDGENLNQFKARIDADLWAAYQAGVTDAAADAVLVSTSEADIAVLLNAREV